MKEKISASALSLSNRFDILLKAFYLRYKGSLLFEKHAVLAYKSSVFCLNNYIEYDSENKIVKSSLDDFIREFHFIDDSISRYGFDSCYGYIPVTDDFPLNGAHRIASCLIHNKDIYVSYSNVDYSHLIFSYSFFKKKFLPVYLLDMVFLNMLDLQDDFFTACLYPSSTITHDKFVELISKECDVVCDFNRTFTETGKVSLMSLLYDGEKWLGDRSNCFKGAKNKYQNCFNGKSNVVRFICFKFKDRKSNLEKVIELKESYRKIAGVGKHSIHITDNHIESINLVRILLSTSGMRWSNQQHFNYLPNFESYLDKLDDFVELNNIDRSAFIIVGSSVLSAFGYRDCSDLDLYSRDGAYHDSDFFSYHNRYFEDLNLDLDSLLLDENNIFYYRNFQFLSLDLLIRFKTLRSESKDLSDLKLINYKGAPDISIPKVKKFLEWSHFYLYNFKFKMFLKKVLKKFGFLE